MSFSRTASAALPLLDSLPEQAQEPDADAEPDHAAYWAGDWYGWHIVTDASEELQYLKDTAWDACAHISVRGDAGMLTVWDTENEPGELLLRASVTFSAGTTDARAHDGGLRHVSGLRSDEWAFLRSWRVGGAYV